METDNNNQSDPTSEKSLIVRGNTNNLTTSKNTNPLISRAVNDALEIAIRSTRSVGRVAGVEAATASKVQEEVATVSMDTVGPVEGAKAANHTVSRAEGAKVFIQYPSGATYHGEMRNGKRHGHGVYTYPNPGGWKYVGEWKEDKEDGMGKTVRSNGSGYEGQYKNGFQHGEGKTIHEGGNTYQGQHKNGSPHGEGITTHTDGWSHRGQYKNGKVRGFGISTQAGPEGFEHIGIREEGGLQGKITYTSRFLMLVFEGEYKDDKKNGKGYEKILKFGTSFKGKDTATFEELRNFILKTQGTETRGTWKDGERHGRFSIIENGIEEICYYENGEKRT